MLETSLNLYQPVRYTRSGKEWFSDFEKALHGDSQQFNVDASAVLSILAFNFPCGDRTLFEEIKRQPWLSSISEDGQTHLESIPPHGFIWDSPEGIAGQLNTLLLDEAEKACCGKEEIYILLSGGLDSRVVAGILYQLRKQGRLKATPTGVTWGLDDSRDVNYARATAEVLGFDWKHIEIGPESLLENIYQGFPMIGGLVPPSHLHRMLWFKNNVGSNALVLAGSYGDSVGRAVFSARHILELELLRPTNPFNLIKKEVIPEAVQGVQQDLQTLRRRAPKNENTYAVCEIEMQCHYMRGMIGQTMNVINNWCTLYQMFTAPQVYGYMWSLHPSLRDDSIYAVLLEKLHPGLARLPWARSNKALRGKTVGSKTGLRKTFHDYTMWASNNLYEEILKLVEPDWFEATGIFDPAQVSFLNTSLAPGSDRLKSYGIKPYDLWLWLAGFRVWRERLQNEGKSIRMKNASRLSKVEVTIASEDQSYLYRLLSGNALLRKVICSIRKRRVKANAIRKWPPVCRKGAK